MGKGQGTIPSDWEGEFCRYAVCWPNSEQWLAILRGVLALPARGRFWDEHTGNILEAQAVIRETYDNNLHLEEVIVSCNDSNLALIADAIRLLAANQCCGEAAPPNGGIQVVVETPLGVEIAIYGSVPPATLPAGETPPGYPGSLEEYENDKCRTAAAMVDGIVSTLRNFSFITWVQTTGLLLVVAAAVAGFIVIPAFLIPTLIAAAIVNVGINAGLVALADAIEADKANWVCIMVENDSVTTIITILSDALDTLIAALPVTGAVGIALKLIAMIVINTDTMNKLFTLTQGSGPSYDCTSCCTGVPIVEFFEPENGNGTGDLSVDGEIRTLTASQNITNGIYYVQFETIADPCCPFNVEVISWSDPAVVYNQALLCDGTIFKNEEDPILVESFNCQFWGVTTDVGGGPFTVDVRLSEA